ncbi:hypothetical protein ACSQ67_002836 [Phaseolus vulgaris]
MAANSSSRGITALGKRVANRIWTSKSPSPPSTSSGMSMSPSILDCPVLRSSIFLLLGDGGSVGASIHGTKIRH